MKFRRKSEPTAQQALEPAPETGQDTEPDAAQDGPVTRTGGPFDESQVADDGIERVDLGSLLIAPGERELRLQVDEKSGVVQSVMLAAQDGALEMQAFAAPRNGDLWSTVRPQIAADITGRGGQAEEREGPFGPELFCQVPTQMPDGTVTLQPARILGVNGERWLLRASFRGRPAVEPDGAQDWEDALAQVVVRRGAGAMAVGEPLPAILPDQARRVR
ncbi:DUF3710 domain-containing protein [Nocardioides piscis]|uniref:DUF3710 domain-containing protein n=1 Tax=Nocardioides piscis TaxID=2714938 RepID=A0A6G7YHG1_9ACTN|nr:DUF3710 domain-containing protein [Nocardioides piscis]QIK76334.1 DUF3710 domain-containing protein [Nocardioides piscis]